MGPALITRDEIQSLEDLTASAAVNGVELASGPVYKRTESIAELVSRLSGSFGLRPGDLIAVACGDELGSQSIRSGDRLSVRLAELMELAVSVEF